MASVNTTSMEPVTLPAHVQEDLHLSSTDQAEWVKVAPNTYQVIVKNRSIREMAGMFRAPKGVCVSLEEMDEIIAEAGAASAMGDGE